MEIAAKRVEHPFNANLPCELPSVIGQTCREARAGSHGSNVDSRVARKFGRPFLFGQVIGGKSEL